MMSPVWVCAMGLLATLPSFAAAVEFRPSPDETEPAFTAITDLHDSTPVTVIETDDVEFVPSAPPSYEAPATTPRRWACVPEGLIPYFGRTPDERRHRGIGMPIEGRGWRSQPFSITAFAGATDGSPYIHNHLNQKSAFYGGFNFAWDYDHYWGIEKRLGFGQMRMTNGAHQPLDSDGMSVTGEYRLMYYPLGDARWRPFITGGVGWSDFYFHDDHGNSHLDTLGMIPFGIGLKYLYNERWAVRIDLIDEFTFRDNTLDDFHYVALTAGIEMRYGRRLLKMPWHGH